MAGALAIPLIGMAGLSIDLARIWLVRSRLQMSIDSAVLVAARNRANCGTTSDCLIASTDCKKTQAWITDACALFWANFDRTSGTSMVGYLGATGSDPQIQNPPPGSAAGSVQMTGSATVSPSILGILGIDPITVSGSATAQSAAFGLELAMVLDNTGSMAGASITSLISASRQLLDILYGGSDTQPHLWVSVVPFAAAVNIGSTHTSWLVGGNINQTPFAPSRWMGCVMARTAKTGAQDGDDFNDKTPSQARLTPFLNPSTYQVYPTNGPLHYTTGSGSKKVIHDYWYPGDNDWTVSPNNIQEPDQSNNSVGPNLACPSLAVLPETTSKAVVLTAINKMVPVYRGGTIISLGLQTGWWTLSPSWKGLWGDASMPLAYATPYMKKAIVLMSDGNNEWYDWPDGVPGQTPPVAPPTGVPAWTADHNADFTAYGRLLTNTRSVPYANVTTTLDTWMSQMCTTIKQNGIIIYTILFNNSSSATQTLFRNCASAPANYFLSPTGADLTKAFQQIGQELSTLRISQ